MNDLLLSVAALKVLSDLTKERYDEMRARAEAQLEAGDRRVVRSPVDGAKIGEVYRSDPKSVPVVTDDEALTEWMVAHYRDQTETKYDVIGTHEQVVAVLFEHAPRLLKPRRVVKQVARQRLIQDATVLRQPVGPGGEVDVPGIEFVQNSNSYVACKPDTDAVLAIFQLHRAGLLDLDGTIKHELETKTGE